MGPTTTWLVRRIATGLDERPEGFELRMDEIARALGVGARIGRHSPIRRAFVRLVQFEIASASGDLLAVRRRLPALARRFVVRLPPHLRQLHDTWTEEDAKGGTLAAQRRRSRSLALELFDDEDDDDRLEVRLMGRGVHPSLAAETTRWARNARLRAHPDGAASPPGSSQAQTPGLCACGPSGHRPLSGTEEVRAHSRRLHGGP